MVYLQAERKQQIIKQITIQESISCEIFSMRLGKLILKFNFKKLTGEP